MIRTIIVCADDYALSLPVSRAILDLAKRGRISAISCMTASPLWPAHGPWLREVATQLDVGLHITLVDEAPLTSMPKTAPDGKLPSLGALIAKSYLGTLNLSEIRAEIAAQVEAFTRVMGFAPRHLDGHLHTHALPGIRDIVQETAHRLTPEPWIRSTREPLSAILRRGVSAPKALFLSFLGRGFSGGRMNDGFSGVYDFAGDYGALFEKFVDTNGARPLILCHPGEATDSVAHAGARAREYDYLASDALELLLARKNARVGRFP